MPNQPRVNAPSTFRQEAENSAKCSEVKASLPGAHHVEPLRELKPSIRNPEQLNDDRHAILAQAKREAKLKKEQ